MPMSRTAKKAAKKSMKAATAPKKSMKAAPKKSMKAVAKKTPAAKKGSPKVMKVAPKKAMAMAKAPAAKKGSSKVVAVPKKAANSKSEDIKSLAEKATAVRDRLMADISSVGGDSLRDEDAPSHIDEEKRDAEVEKQVEEQMKSFKQTSGHEPTAQGEWEAWEEALYEWHECEFHKLKKSIVDTRGADAVLTAEEKDKLYEIGEKACEHAMNLENHFEEEYYGADSDSDSDSEDSEDEDEGAEVDSDLETQSCPAAVNEHEIEMNRELDSDEEKEMVSEHLLAEMKQNIAADRHDYYAKCHWDIMRQLDEVRDHYLESSLRCTVQLQTTKNVDSNGISIENHNK